MTVSRNVVIRAARAPVAPAGAVEMCEHKGIGHPDTLTDGACEAAARALAQAYLARCGRVRHFNVDKGLLVAGRSAPRFGGGQIIEPAKLIVCGRATPGAGIDVRAVVTDAVAAFLRKTVRCDPAMFQIATEIRQGSASLGAIYGAGRTAALANDTSFGVGFAPLSALESQVLQVAALLRSPVFRLAFPAAGDDVKVMGLAQDGTMRFTLALAMVDRHVRSVAHYQETKRAICDYVLQTLPVGSSVALNCLDRSDASDEDGLYLTVSGLSAEMGDDGQVGRGNRVNGLMTPGRPMSLEAVAGKNPVAHVGKIYNVLADVIARDIAASIPAVTTVEVQLLSTIGQPLDQPQVALVDVGPEAALTAAVRLRISALVNARFDCIDELIADLIAGTGPRATDAR